MIMISFFIRVKLFNNLKFKDLKKIITRLIMGAKVYYFKYATS